ncbi:unnamed protein product [Acanthoscelides obtectus]|uniref:Uncharacterized protein n=1 Tax=Acanthoscelides obtectus TaxID=200917 RepID=A0A9P0Q5W7_ACAOB|nr:unnamed protein product [Acanthoscelides obtectus]CAK1627107.1 hypothetical protein AOBTE_LOCUS4308 [Acanthoscelides obtectus]
MKPRYRIWPRTGVTIARSPFPPNYQFRVHSCSFKYNTLSLLHIRSKHQRS